MNRIRELRKAKQLTMKELGSMLCLSESTISLYENGKHYPDMETLLKLAEFFSVSVDYLLGREEQKKTPADPMQEKRAHLVSLLMQFTDEEIQRFEDFAAGILAARR